MQSVWVPEILLLIVIGAVLSAFHLFRAYQNKKKPRSPLGCDILRGPGHTYLAQIQDLNETSQTCQIALFTIPILAFATHVSYSYFARAPESWLRISASIGTALLFMVGYTWKLMRSVNDRRACRQAVEGEVAVGQELSLLMAEGYRVFHDFPAGAFKIDHIVIGPTGVMAVETRTHSRNRRADAVLTYDGRMLHYPKFSDYETIDRAKMKADWLSQWLTETLDEEVYARAMVAVPGWVVKRTSADGIPVVNPTQFANLFKYIKPRPMSQDLMLHMVRLIEGRCRDVAPGAEDRYIADE